jgi:transcriptional regulator with XRE-family HTH domain
VSLVVSKTVSKVVIDDKATGENIRTVRLIKGLSLREAGAKLGCSCAYLCDLENGRRSWGGRKGKGYIALAELWAHGSGKATDGEGG